MTGSLRERLLAEGWEERFSAAGARLRETADYYAALGYEVRIEDVVESAAPDACTSCFAEGGAEGPVGVIFTRRGLSGGEADDDLFDV